ncbi:MAG TPA: GNAT family protein [Verrucomicrobiae bacterium]
MAAIGSLIAALFADKQPNLSTERLLLRGLELSDAGEIQRLAGDRKIADTTLLIPHPYPDGAAAEFITNVQRDWKEQKSAVFALRNNQSSAFCGTMGLSLDHLHSRAELGYWIAVPLWGQGLCTEAARALLEFGFTQLSLHRIWAQHFSRNPASGRVLQKLGMRHEGQLRQHIKKADCFEDTECYGILQQEWPVARSIPGA